MVKSFTLCGAAPNSNAKKITLFLQCGPTHGLSIVSGSYVTVFGPAEQLLPVRWKKLDGNFDLAQEITIDKKNFPK